MAFAPNINWLAVVVSAIAYFVIGWLWFGPLFGKWWAKEMKMDMPAKPSMADMAKPMAMSIIGYLLVVIVFAHVLEAFTERAWMEGGAERTIAMALEGAGWTWLGFFLPKELDGVAWQKRSWGVAAINGAYHLVALGIVAVILTVWT